MTEQKKYHLPLGQFASNITTEALINKDSMLYHEDEGFYSGHLGYVKPFSTAVYGNFDLVESLAAESHSPLDVNLPLRFSWDADQVEAYGRITLITFASLLAARRWWQHSYALVRAFKTLKRTSSDLYKLDGNASENHSTDIYRRLTAIVEFFEDAIKTLDEQRPTFDPSVSDGKRMIIETTICTTGWPT